jgi:hypothetical protein
MKFDNLTFLINNLNKKIIRCLILNIFGVGSGVQTGGGAS